AGDPPALEAYRESVGEYAARYEQALAKASHDDECDALWGLVARGSESVTWCEQQLRSGDDLRISDAAGGCAWIDLPSTLVDTLRQLVVALPDPEGRDSVAGALPAEVRAELTREDDEAAAHAAPGREILGCQIVWYVEAPLERVVADLRRWRARLRD